MARPDDHPDEYEIVPGLGGTSLWSGGERVGSVRRSVAEPEVVPDDAEPEPVAAVPGVAPSAGVDYERMEAEAAARETKMAQRGPLLKSWRFWVPASAMAVTLAAVGFVGLSRNNNGSAGKDKGITNAQDRPTGDPSFVLPDDPDASTPTTAPTPTASAASTAIESAPPVSPAADPTKTPIAKPGISRKHVIELPAGVVFGYDKHGVPGLGKWTPTRGFRPLPSMNDAYLAPDGDDENKMTNLGGANLAVTGEFKKDPTTGETVQSDSTWYKLWVKNSKGKFVESGVVIAAEVHDREGGQKYLVAAKAAGYDKLGKLEVGDNDLGVDSNLPSAANVIDTELSADTLTVE